MNKIKSREISVVVQGPIHHQDNLTKRVLESVREHLPDAELILSTWKGSDVSGLCFDILVENDDPGAFKTGYSIDNVNRQILSTLNGIKSSRRHYILKIRTDSILTSDKFLSFYFQFPKRNSYYSIFNHRIITLTLFSRDPSLYCRLFHPSDIAQFGSRADLLMLWDVPLLDQSKMPKKEFTEYVPESYIFLNSLKRNGFIEETYRCLRFS
ncbi:MAG: WavE lipopolysaccharide synthesis family protein, partial [Gloeomargarita sp. SKYG116]|nr:WavE lipopolysaccharide synthesis family protein [Gloeomargarita sp. SKYG116]MDW8402415.1 WavE lipopolysaccharide synthesis family protein [Gloeomargarita sp. SKYGB_i_bin116]